MMHNLQALTHYRCAEEFGLNTLARFAEMRIKHRHTIVEKWPTRLKLRPGQVGAEEEVAILLATDSSYTERYVEWARSS